MITLIASGCQTTGAPPLEVVPSVDLNRYKGLWYEIARYPNRFEKGLVGATAHYEIRDDGDVQVINRGLEETLDGARREAKGKAWVVDPATNAKLKVSFFWPFRGDYWIIDLANDYSYAVVGEPKRRYLWILARNPQIDDALYNQILERVRQKGFEPERLERPPQKAQPELAAANPQ